MNHSPTEDRLPTDRSPSAARSSVLLLLLLLLLSLPTLASAQDKVRFHTSKHLQGYDECYMAAHHDLYDFEPFEKLEGRLVTPEQLLGLRARWGKERVRVRALIEKLEADPQARFLRKLNRRLEHHPFFAHVDYTVVDSYAPIIFYVQKPLKKVSDYEKKITSVYGPWLQALLQLFQKNNAQPFGLKRRPDYGAFVLAILASRGAYADYRQAVRKPDLYIARAHYDPNLRMAVTYQDVFAQRGGREAEHRRAALHEMVHVMQHAYRTGADRPPEALWLTEGMADYLSCHVGSQPGPDALARLDIEALHDIAGRYTTGQPGQLGVLPLTDLLEVKSYTDVAAHAARQRGTPGIVHISNRSLPVFYRQSALLMYFLHNGAEGNYHSRVSRYIADALRGDSGPVTFSRAFDGIDLDGLERRFVAFLGEEAAKRWPHFAMEKLRARAPGDTLSAGGTNVSEREMPFPTAALALTDSDTEARFSMALVDARKGNLGQAISKVKELKAPSGDDSWSQRLVSTARRIEALADLRRKVLDHFIASHKNIRFEHQGETHLGRVVRYDDSSVVLHRYRHAPETLPLHALDPVTVMAINDSKHLDLADTEARRETQRLCGNPVYQENLQDDPEENESLLAEAAAYARWIHLGEVALTLDDLSQRSTPESPDEAKALCSEVKELLRASRVESNLIPLVEKRLPVLREMASYALNLVLDADESSYPGLHAQVESADEGRQRITYTFDSKNELEDFNAVDYLQAERRSSGVLLVGPPSGSYEVSDGDLVLYGAVCLRHVLSFDSPMTVEYEISYRTPEVRTSGPWDFRLGICDDGHGNRIGCRDLGFLTVIDKTGPFIDSVGGSTSVIQDMGYKVTVHHDGKRIVEAAIDDRPYSRIKCGPRKKGGLFLWAHTDRPIAISRLVIEARIEDTSTEQLRRTLLKKEIGKIGL